MMLPKMHTATDASTAAMPMGAHLDLVDKSPQPRRPMKHRVIPAKAAIGNVPK